MRRHARRWKWRRKRQPKGVRREGRRCTREGRGWTGEGGSATFRGWGQHLGRAWFDFEVRTSVVLFVLCQVVVVNHSRDILLSSGRGRRRVVAIRIGFVFRGRGNALQLIHKLVSFHLVQHTFVHCALVSRQRRHWPIQCGRWRRSGQRGRLVVGVKRMIARQEVALGLRNVARLPHRKAAWRWYSIRVVDRVIIDGSFCIGVLFLQRLHTGTGAKGVNTRARMKSIKRWAKRTLWVPIPPPCQVDLISPRSAFSIEAVCHPLVLQIQPVLVPSIGGAIHLRFSSLQ